MEIRIRVRIQASKWCVPGMMYALDPSRVWPDIMMRPDEHKEYDLLVVCHPDDETKARDRYLTEGATIV